MPTERPPDWDRARDLERIRAAYAAYDAEGRGRLWDRRSRGYARLAADLDEQLHDALARSVDDAGPNVLDLGCGTGELARLAPTLNASWTGVDLRAEAIETARESYPHASFLVASADDLPFPDASHDVIVACLLFSSLPSLELEQAVARAIGRVVRPGGWLVWLDIRYPNPANRAVHAMSRARIEELFEGWSAEFDTAGVLPPIARRLGIAVGLAYPSLRALPFLRSHLVGRLRKPHDADA